MNQTTGVPGRRAATCSVCAGHATLRPAGKITAWVGETTDVHDERTKLERLRERYETEKHVSDTLQRALLADSLPNVAGTRARRRLPAGERLG
ncbi:MAG: hypothetical protein ACLPYS_05450 [Vulcanimicrobiaceae bacterium]